MTEEKNTTVMKLYTTNLDLVIGLRHPTPRHPALREPAPLNLSEAIEGQVTGCNNSVYGMGGSPGVIVKNPEEGHNIYGLHSRAGDFFDFFSNPFFYGNLGNPKKLLDLLGHSRERERVVNGCVISINAIHGKDRKYDWLIHVGPDWDLREQYPERFDDSLVESLERTVSDYIERSGVSDKVTHLISPETAKWDGSPFHRAFWKND